MEGSDFFIALLVFGVAWYLFNHKPKGKEPVAPTVVKEGHRLNPEYTRAVTEGVTELTLQEQARQGAVAADFAAAHQEDNLNAGQTLLAAQTTAAIEQAKLNAKLAQEAAAMQLPVEHYAEIQTRKFTDKMDVEKVRELKKLDVWLEQQTIDITVTAALRERGFNLLLVNEAKMRALEALKDYEAAKTEKEREIHGMAYEGHKANLRELTGQGNVPSLDGTAPGGLDPEAQFAADIGADAKGPADKVPSD